MLYSRLFRHISSTKAGKTQSLDLPALKHLPPHRQTLAKLLHPTIPIVAHRQLRKKIAPRRPNEPRARARVALAPVAIRNLILRARRALDQQRTHPAHDAEVDGARVAPHVVVILPARLVGVRVRVGARARRVRGEDEAKDGQGKGGDKACGREHAVRGWAGILCVGVLRGLCYFEVLLQIVTAIISEILTNYLPRF